MTGSGSTPGSCLCGDCWTYVWLTNPHTCCWWGAAPLAAAACLLQDCSWRTGQVAAGLPVLRVLQAVRARDWPLAWDAVQHVTTFSLVGRNRWLQITRQGDGCLWHRHCGSAVVMMHEGVVAGRGGGTHSHKARMMAEAGIPLGGLRCAAWTRGGRRLHRPCQAGLSASGTAQTATKGCKRQVSGATHGKPQDGRGGACHMMVTGWADW